MAAATYQGRGEWAEGRVGKLAVQVGDRRGVAVHWPGFKFALPNHRACLALVARLEREALPRGYGAIPYNDLACPHGYRIEGRGAGRRSGANGSNVSNDRYGSVCALLPIGGKPTPGMLLAILAALDIQAPGGKLLTHGQVRPEPTACPGPDLTLWIKHGAPRPAEPPAAGDRTHVVRAGETLWSLALRYYRDGRKWERIAKANRVRESDALAPGRRLRIPR